MGVIIAVVNRIHQARLSWGISGGHGEIGIATKVSQQADFIVEATPTTIGPRIIQRPVPVDESERQLPIALPQQTMFAYPIRYKNRLCGR